MHKRQKFKIQLLSLRWFIYALVVCFLIVLWMAGVVYSELPMKAKLDDEFEPVDAIVCLTGGRGRIRKALEIYEQGYGRTLYISGTERSVDRQTQMKEILRELKWIGPVDSSRIILENVSTNTIENAEQTKRFLQQQNLKSILLVTSIYHARRAAYVFKTVLPKEVRIEVSWPESGAFGESEWWTRWNSLVVTITEFIKFFYAYFRLAIYF